MDQDVDHGPETAVDSSKSRGLKGLLVAQFLGQFNDQAWKQIVILLAIAAAVNETEGQSTPPSPRSS